MIIDIDLTGEPATIELIEPDDCKRLHVAARGGDPEAPGAVLPAHDVGRLLPSGDALIEIDAVRRLAAGKVPDGWERGEAIQAHIEWS